jgi:hypothetical protein
MSAGCGLCHRTDDETGSDEHVRPAGVVVGVWRDQGFECEAEADGQPEEHEDENSPAGPDDHGPTVSTLCRPRDGDVSPSSAVLQLGIR